MSDHLCHHPHCDLPVPPRMLSCQPHWFQLPKSMRDRVWELYTPGQERRKNPSDDYVAFIKDEVIPFWLSKETAVT